MAFILPVLFFSTAAFSASVLQSPQDSRGGPPGSLSAPTAPLELPLDLPDGPVLESVGSSAEANVSVLLPSVNDSSLSYDTPFEYPDLNLNATTNDDVECKESFGVDLSRVSCETALQRFPKTQASVTWGQRYKAAAKMHLPYRVSSYDAFCAIDVVHGKGALWDESSPLALAQAASTLIQRCVKNGAPNTGGLIRNLGRNRNLVVVVRLYKPNVNCYPNPPGRLRWAEDCERLLSAVPVTTERLVFGKQGDPSTRVIVPRSYRVSRAACAGKLDPPNDGHAVTARWFDVWEAGHAVNMICNQPQTCGIAKDIGGPNGLRLTLSAIPRGPGATA